MELQISDCRNCPLYHFYQKGGLDQWSFISECKHPIGKELTIKRAYDKGGVYPITPNECPLKKEDLIIKQQQ